MKPCYSLDPQRVLVQLSGQRRIFTFSVNVHSVCERIFQSFLFGFCSGWHIFVCFPLYSVLLFLLLFGFWRLLVPPFFPYHVVGIVSPAPLTVFHYDTAYFRSIPYPAYETEHIPVSPFYFHSAYRL